MKNFRNEKLLCDFFAVTTIILLESHYSPQPAVMLAEVFNLNRADVCSVRFF